MSDDRDPILDLFGDMPDFPGKTPPKNRATSRPQAMREDELNGARGKFYRIKGEDVELFTIGEVARAIGRQPVTVRAWESRGWIPKANFRTPAPARQQIPGKATKGRRLYTRQQVEFLAKAVSSFSLDLKTSPDWPKFREYVRANWPA